MARGWVFLLAAGLLAAFGRPAWAGPSPQIRLPDLLAVELPRGVPDLGPNDPPLRDLLASARSDDRKVTADLAGRAGPGPVKVTWTAWDTAGQPVASRSGVIFVLPTGFTPVGTASDENATAGNNAVRIVHDKSGHVHMIWAGSGGSSGRAGPVYRRAAVAGNGTVTLETPPVYVADPGPADWNAYPSLTLAGTAVQLVWQGGGTVRTRSVSSAAGGFALGPVIDTRARSGGRDTGPAIAADARGLHIVTPDGIYAFSGDAGATWKTAAVPLPEGQHVKTASLAVTDTGEIDIAFSSIAREKQKGASTAGGGGWWQLRTIQRTVRGTWENPRDALAGFPGWQAPGPDEDVLADWVRIAKAEGGGLHATWHGTKESRIYGNDAAFYAWRSPFGVWETPVRLVPQDPAHGTRFSFAPSLAVDGRRALALAFYDVYAGEEWIGFDSALAVLHDGWLEGPRIPVTQFVAAAIASGHRERALSTRFPAAAPEVWRADDGHAWLDVLETLGSRFPGAQDHLIVYHRLDVTAALAE